MGKTFDTRRDAQAWLTRERAGLAGGIDPRAGRTTVRKLLPTWLEEQRVTVTAKTYVADSALPRLLPNSFASLHIGAVTRALITLTRQGLAAVRERIIASNPVIGTRVPTVGKPPVEMHPFREEELEAF